MIDSTSLFIAGLIAIATPPNAPEDAERHDTLFETTVQTVFGQSVFLLGDLPELGGGDLTRAVKLDASGYPIWRINVSLPADTDYDYQYYIRNDGPGQTSDPANGTPTGPALSGTTPRSDPPTAPGCDGRTILYHSSCEYVTLHWRQDNPAYAAVRMMPLGDARSDTETRFAAWGFSDPDAEIRFYFEDASGQRDPVVGEYRNTLPALLVQDGAAYDYLPAPTVSPARRDYVPASPPAITSTHLGQTRRYRVLLPRGYDEHTQRTYPVVYFHDGQNVFEFGPFGSWNADNTIPAMIEAGTLREVIAVGVDNVGSTRLDDYRPPQDGGRADDYARFLIDELKPVIDAQYRTRTGPADTIAIGSSMGGLVSLYLGWEFPATFGRVGAMSGSWQFNSLPARIAGEPARDIRIYLDSGDCCGGSSDNYWLSYALRDSLAGSNTPRYAIEGTLRHTIGFGQQHNESAWAARLPAALGFLAPPTVATNDLLATTFGAHWDTNNDGRITVDDLHTHTETPVDLNLDFTTDDNDTRLLESLIRSNESAVNAEPAR